MNPPEQILSDRPAGTPEPVPGTKILVIDDEAYVRSFIRLTLQRAGYEVLEAANGREGLRLYQLAHPACVVADMRMPEMDGIELIMAIRARKQKVGIIAISGGFDAYTPVCLKSARLLGADMILHKPFSPDDLIETVAHLVQLHGRAVAS